MEFGSSRYQGGRNIDVWLDEFPFDAYEPEGWITGKKKASNQIKPLWQSACFKSYSHVGGRVNRGIIGANFAENNSSEITINVGVYRPLDRPYKTEKYDESYIGLDNYAGAVARGLSEGIDGVGGFPGGDLTVTHTVHWTVDSNEAYFFKMAKVLPALFLATEDQYSSGQFVDIIDGIMK